MLIEYLNVDNFFESITSSYLNILFSLLIRNHEDKFHLAPSTSKTMQKIGKILSYIQANFKTVALTDLAQQFHYTPQHISKIIKRHTRLCFIELIQNLRLEYAVQELLSTDLSIAVIAYHAGYESTEHFIRVFKAKYGLPPRQYRQKKSKG